MGILDFFRKFGIKFRSAGYSGLSGYKPVDQEFESLFLEDKVPGLAITILRDSEIIFDNGYGYSDIDSRRPVLPEKSVFRAASASKPIAATALLKMVRDGLIDLDRSFYDYVPYFPRKKYDFTIRQLASHTAGIRSYRGKEYALNKPLSIREGISLFKDDELLFKPGTAYHYNSLDWVLVSLAMEEAGGMPFYEYVRRKVLDPLGMHATRPEIPGKLVSGEVTKYTRRKSGFKEAVAVDNRYKLAGGGFLTTTHDLCTLGNAYLDEIIPADGLTAEFLSPVVIDGKSTFYGLGWEVSQDRNGRPYYGHTGNGVGGYSNFYVYPASKTVIATLINCTDPGVQNILDELYGKLLISV